MKTIKTILPVLALALVCNAWGENSTAKISVETKEGLNTYEMYDSGKMYFSGNSLVIETSESGENKQLVKFELADINKLLFFSEETASQNIGNNTLSLGIYPNPSSDYINVSLPTGENYPYNVFSANGSVVKTGQITNGGRIDIQSLTPGIYFLQIGNVYIKFSKI